MATQIFYPFTLEAGVSWYFWFEPAAIPDDRLCYFLARGHASALDAGPTTQDVWVPRIWSNAAGGGYYSYRVLVENQNGVPIDFEIAAYLFND
jgi:hypothetical protein